MKIRIGVVTLFAVSMAFALGCLRSRGQLPIAASQPKSFQPTRETGPYTVLGYIEHRSTVYTVKSGDMGIVYSGRDKNGKVLFDNLSSEQLESKMPDVHDFIERANAGSASLRSETIAPAGATLWGTR